MAIVVFSLSGALVLGGLITAIAGAVVSSNQRNDTAVAGFVAGGTGMVFAGAIGAAVGYLYWPSDPAVAARAPVFGSSMTWSF